MRRSIVLSGRRWCYSVLVSTVHHEAELRYAVERLSESGAKVTRARRAVLEVMADSRKHLSSTEIVARVLERAPSVGRASVFRTLDLLSRLAIVRPTFLSGRAPVYVLMSEDGHHAHIVCPRCLNVIEIDECHLSHALNKIAQDHDIHVVGHLLEVYGLCAPCR